MGQFKAAHFFDNVGGINSADSPFKVQGTQATGGRNFEYTLTGGFRKIKGATKLNGSADSQLKTLGMGVHTTSSGTKTVIRASVRKIQSIDVSTGTIANLSDDTVSAATDILAAANTQVVTKSQFNSTSTNLLWLAGGGMSLPYGVYSATKVTKNGVAVPTGSFTATRSAAGTGAFASTGTYFYSVAFRKTSTQAISNAVLDVSATVSIVTDKVTIDLSSLSNVDTTLYDKVYIYRSAVSGVTGFTTGDLIAQVNSSTTTYDDLGSYISTAQNIPRAGNTLLDNSVLPSGTYNALTTWKRRLVTAAGSTLYISDVNKSESWPTGNYFTLPSGGPITGLAVISLTTATSSSIDELLVIFKEQELWVLTGSSSSDWALKFIDYVGCPNQNLVVNASGYLSWIDYRGVWMWSGSGKPIYASRLIGDFFKEDGDFDKSGLVYGWGEFFRNRDQIIWVVSDIVNGTNLVRIKMDTRLTLPQIQGGIGGSTVDAVFILDILNRAYYAGCTHFTGSEELLLCGDGAGYVYKDFTAFIDSSSAIDFRYETPYHDMGSPGVAKRYNKVIVWCEDSSDATLTLDFWTSYLNSLADSGTVTQQQSYQSSEAYWDLAYWDATNWDNTARSFNAVVFNLDSQVVASEGDTIRLRFKQQEANAPVTIAGYTILYSEVATRK